VACSPDGKYIASACVVSADLTINVTIQDMWEIVEGMYSGMMTETKRTTQKNTFNYD